MAFKLFRHKSNGVVKSYPEHYATHPVFGDDLEPYDPSDEHEEEKVVSDNHELPVEQRGTLIANQKPELDSENELHEGDDNVKEND